MEEKKTIKISLSTLFLILTIIIILVMAYFLIKFYNEKTAETEKSIQLQSKINSLNSEVINSQVKINSTSDITNNKNLNTAEKNPNTKNNYISNFSQSVAKELGEGNTIDITLKAIDYEDSTGYLSVNNKHEAYIYLSNFSEFSSVDNLKKIADNVVNVWYCMQGQAPGNNYIVFLKTDGTVTYVRFRTTIDGKTNFESEEKILNGITNISNIITISGNDADGIGGAGVLFIKDDGTCLPFSTLDDLIK